MKILRDEGRWRDLCQMGNDIKHRYINIKDSGGAVLWNRMTKR